MAAADTVQPPEPGIFSSQARDDNKQPLATNVSPGITGSNIRNSNNDEDESGLAGSAIAGIVVGVLFLIAVLAFLLWRYRKKSKRRHMSRLSGPLYPERRNTTGSVAVFQGLNMSLSSIKNTVGLAPSSTASNEAANMKEMPANASTRHYPKLTIIGGPVSSNGSSQNGPFSSKKGEATAELKEGALPEETVLHIPPEQLRLIQELLLSKGPASVTSADGERFLMEQAKNDPRIKAWLETAVRTHYSSISAGSELPYNVKLDHLVDSLGLSAPKEAKSPKRVSEDA